MDTFGVKSASRTFYEIEAISAISKNTNFDTIGFFPTAPLGYYFHF